MMSVNLSTSVISIGMIKNCAPHYYIFTIRSYKMHFYDPEYHKTTVTNDQKDK